MQLRIGNKTIGRDQPCYTIAEIGLNHNGRINIALKLIDEVAEAGFDAVKTQRRNLETLYRPSILDQSETADKGVQYIMPYLRSFELSDRDFAKVKEHAESLGLDFLCTPFDLESARFLVEEMELQCLKVASADLVNLPLLERLLGYNLPLLISTGMSTEDEVRTTYEYLKEKEAQYAFLHCNSNYPAPFQQINLKYLKKMKQDFDVPIGYSGHELGYAVSVAAVAMGADMVERHVTLDRTMEGPDHAASLEPTGFKKMVRDIKNIETAMGSGGRSLSRGEVMNRQALGKSLVAARDLDSGDIVTKLDIQSLSPGDGLSPQRYFDLINKKISRKINKGEPFLVSDVETDAVDIVGSVEFPYGAIARWHDLQFMLDNFEPTIVEIHMTAQDMDERPTLQGITEAELVIHMPEHYGNLLLDLCSLEEDHRRWSVDRVKEAASLTVEVAKHFNKTPDRPKMVVHPGAMSVDSFVGSAEILQMHDQIQRSLDELEGIEVEIMLENLPPFPWYLGGQWFTNYTLSAKDMLAIIKGRDLGITFDTSHSQLYCNWAGVDIVDEFRSLMPAIRHLHVSDASGTDGEGLQIGRGNIPWERVAPFLFGKDVVIMPEIWLGHLNGMAGMHEALFHLQMLWKKWKNESSSLPNPSH